MTETAPAERRHAALVARLAGLRKELEQEVASSARAEAAVADLRDLAGVLQLRAEWLEDENSRMRRRLGGLLLRRAWPFALAGLAGGFGTAVLLRLTGW
jgi:hypothetical protein